MAEAFSRLASYFQYSFVIYALIVAVLISLCAALVGVTLVLKRLSNIGDGLSHVAFGAVSISTIIGIASSNNMLIVFPVTFLVSFFLVGVGNGKKTKGDSAVAMISVGSLALGYFLVNAFSTSSNLAGDVCSTLFGSTSILTLSSTQVWICFGVCVATLIIYVILYNKIFLITFDESFARASGVNTRLYNTILSLLISAIIVVAINLVGSLLVTALLVFPAMCAMKVCTKYKNVIIVAAILSVICAVFGMLLSIMISTPVGSTIVLFDVLCFIICLVINKIKGVSK